MDYRTKLIYRSNFWYNDGLRRANIRDLSGAIISLKRSVKYHKENITARNLLGLIYFGQGEIGSALVQWIISKNLKTHENIASYYIKMVEETPSEFDSMAQALQKFNQCLVYCRQNGEDLAVIQLKKVVASHPTYLKALQLLSLLYLETEQYAKARQILRKAHKIDNTNPITLIQMHELNHMRKKRPASIKKEPQEQTVTYNLGNETIIQPASSIQKEKGGVFTVMNIVIGVVMGAAVIWFLIVPAISQSKAFQANREIVAYSDEIAARNAEISALKKELDGLRSASDETQNAQQTAVSTQSSYELLIQVKGQYDSKSVSNANMVENLLKVNLESLGEQGKKQFNDLTSAIYPSVLNKSYPDAVASYEAANYSRSIELFSYVISMDSGYDSGKALLYLANSYASSGDSEKAATYYNQIIQTFPDTDIASRAASGLEGTVPNIE